MELNKILKSKKTFFLILVCSSIALAIIAMRIFSAERVALLKLISVLLSPYFYMAEIIANGIIKFFIDGVSIENHKIIFNNHFEYFNSNKAIIENWSTAFLYYKWSAFLLACFWIIKSPVKRKIRFTFLFVFTHFSAVVCGLVMIAGVGPILKNPELLATIGHDILGIFLFFGLFTIWIKGSLSYIESTCKSIRINFTLPVKKLNEILIVFFLFLFLNNFLVPYLNHDILIAFYLNATKLMVSIFGYGAEINGNYLIGTYGGELFIAKWCLGLKTMFIFSALVFLTRKKNLTCWVFIGFGLVFLHLLNSIRLSYLFIFVQHNSNSQMIMEHHDIYNIVVYFFIFVLWIIWFEKFTSIRKKTR